MQTPTFLSAREASPEASGAAASADAAGAAAGAAGAAAGAAQPASVDAATTVASRMPKNFFINNFLLFVLFHTNHSYVSIFYYVLFLLTIGLFILDKLHKYSISILYKMPFWQMPACPSCVCEIQKSPGLYPPFRCAAGAHFLVHLFRFLISSGTLRRIRCADRSIRRRHRAVADDCLAAHAAVGGA